MAWVAEETFDSYSDGGINGKNDGSGFSGAWSQDYGSDITVQGTYKYQGAKGLLMGASGQSCRRTLSADVSGLMVLYIALGARQTSGDSTKGMDFSLRNTADAGVITLRIDKVDSWGTEGHIQLLGRVGGTITAVDILTYTADVPVVIELTINTTTGACSARYSTAAVGSSTPAWSTPVTCDVLNSGSIRYVNPNKDTTNKQYFLDYISPTSPFPSGPANLKTFDGVAKANIKTIDGIAIGGVKTINGIA